MDTPRKQSHLSRRRQGRLVRIALITAALAIVGVLLLQGGQAATFVTQYQAENGAPAGNTAPTTTSAASNGAAITFGTAVAPPPPGPPPPPPPPSAPAPTGLRAWTGGDSIALQWNVYTPDTSINRYEVYRNGTKIGTTTPRPNVGGERYGTLFMDRSVAKGTTYSYQVKAINKDGSLSPASSSLSVTHPSNSAPVPTVRIDPVVASISPGLNTWLRDVGTPILRDWYPKAMQLLAYPDYTPRMTITMSTNSTTDWNCCAGYVGGDAPAGTMMINPTGHTDYPEYLGGTVLHESVHILESSSGGFTPGWFTEGIADFATNYMLNAVPAADNLPIKPAAKAHFALDPYDTGSWLHNHIYKNVDSGYGRRFMIAAHNGTVNASHLSAGGKDVNDVFAQARNISLRSGAIRSGLSSNKCIDISNSQLKNGTAAQLWDCNGSIAQRVTIGDMGDGTVGLIVLGKCLDVANGGTTNGTIVWLYSCGKENSKKWTIRPDGSLLSKTGTNKCLDVSNSQTANGTRLQLWDCNGSSAQRWTLP